jgi:hypothetical protein
MEWKETILVEARPALTLDAAVLDATKTFYNGCSYAAYFGDESVEIRYGCYGGPYSLSGMSKEAVVKHVGKPLNLHPATLTELKARIPCSRCGAPFFIIAAPKGQSDE